jgi:hypothetical protein
MASAAEREIRDAVVDWWHKNEPQGRVVHELPLSSFSGKGRADLGIIFPDAVVLVEIKSERDKLDRLATQFDEMSKRSHAFQIVAHEKWFDEEGGLKDQTWMKWSHKEHLWRYPSPKWTFERYRLPLRPSNWLLLDLLWADELRACYPRAGIAASQRGMNMHQMTYDLHEKLTGRQITRVVCAALRARAFSEADPACEAQ